MGPMAAPAAPRPGRAVNAAGQRRRPGRRCATSRAGRAAEGIFEVLSARPGALGRNRPTTRLRQIVGALAVHPEVGVAPALALERQRHVGRHGGVTVQDARQRGPGAAEAARRLGDGETRGLDALETDRLAEMARLLMGLISVSVNGSRSARRPRPRRRRNRNTMRQLALTRMLHWPAGSPHLVRPTFPRQGCHFTLPKGCDLLARER